MRADEVHHAHKETVATTDVSSGNYKQAVTRHDDAGNIKTGSMASIANDIHIPIANGTGNYSKGKNGV
jgi:hypothetical protein